MPLDPALNGEEYCYVRTTGRVTGNPHEIEIWFALDGAALYILAGGRHDSDWVKNAKKQSSVLVRIAGVTYAGVARIVGDAGEDALARRLLLAKYSPRHADLDDWGRDALPVAIDLTTEA